jgi:tyrosyl-DNA phosphodiesterase 1
MDPYADEDEAMAASVLVELAETYPNGFNSAIAASLAVYKDQEARQGQKPEVLTVDDSDEEDEDAFQGDLERALRASAQEASSKPVVQVANGTQGEEVPNAPIDSDKAVLASDFLRQRAQLEKERLARSRGIIRGPPTASAISAGKKRGYSESQSDSEEDQPQAKRNLPSSSSSRATTSKGNTSSSSADSNDEDEELFYNHELRPTANRFTEKSDLENRRKTFRMSQLIGPKEKISFAIISSYCTEPIWMSGFFSPEVR